MIGVYVANEETSTKVQHHAFKLDFRWRDTVGSIESQHTDKHFLVFDKEDKIIIYSDHGSDYGFKYFCEAIEEELSVEQFLSLTQEDIDYDKGSGTLYKPGLPAILITWSKTGEPEAKIIDEEEEHHEK